MRIKRLSLHVICLFGLLITTSCAQFSATQVSPLQQAWQEVRSFSGSVIDNEDALKQKIASLKHLSQLRELAQREADCASHANPAQCIKEGLRERIFVTGSRISDSDLITNNQEAGIDEGGIVKKLGNYLLVLRNGTLYSIALREGGRDSLQVVDMLLAAEDDSGRGVWYDEILALDGRIVLLGYGGGTQLIGFSIDDSGRLHRRWHYTLNGNDYFSDNNYGMRLLGDRLIFQQTLSIDSSADIAWPEWRRGNEPLQLARPLLENYQILFPGLMSDTPDLHLLLSCSLPLLEQGDFACDAAGVLSDSSSELYVTESTAYLALSGWNDELYLEPDFVSWGFSSRLNDSQLQTHRQTWLARFDLINFGTPELARVQGELRSQFWLKELDGDLHVLSNTGYGEDANVLLHRVGRQDFTHTGQSLIAPRTTMPGEVHGPARLTSKAAYVVQAANNDDVMSVTSSVSMSILDLHQDGITQLELEFEPDRLETIQEHLLVTGHTNNQLKFVLLQDQAKPYLLDQLALYGFQQSEHRSHAFNFGQPATGRTVFGLPVITQAAANNDTSDYIDRVSDLLLIDMSENRLQMLGLVDMASHAKPEPKCELSCFDWYGNARLFFVGERIFALSADQLVELRLVSNAVQKVAQIRLTAPIN